MLKKSLYICIAVIIIMVIAIVVLSRENFIMSPSAPQVPEELEGMDTELVPVIRASIPFPAIKGYELQNSLLQKLLQSIHNPQIITRLLADLRKSAEDFGLVMADGSTGICTGVWMYDVESSSWSLFPTIREEEDKSANVNSYYERSLKVKLQSLGENDHIGIGVKAINTVSTPVLPDMTNTFWVLKPSHANGVPTLRRMLNTPQGLEQPIKINV